MSSSGKLHLNIEPLRLLRAQAKAWSNARVKVGVLGDDAERDPVPGKPEAEEGPINNPSLGAIHEFGCKQRNIPARSWLRLPLMMKLGDRLREIGAAAFNQMADNLGPRAALSAMGNEAMVVVDQAFATGGYGQWPQWSRSYARRNELRSRRAARKSKFVGPIKPGSLLIQSAQLRQSVSYSVVGGPA